MSQRSPRLSSWVLSAALTTACLGGQTGQPTSLDCERSEQPADATWRELTAEQLGRAFEGSHVAPLYWVREVLGAPTATPIELDDTLSLGVRYDGEPGVLSSCDTLFEVPVTIELSTSASGLVDQGRGVLVFGDTQRPLRAVLSFGGAAVALNGTLTEVETGQAPDGTLQPHTGAAPGAWASFPAPAGHEANAETVGEGGSVGHE
jgi:hypothetical protein